MSLPGAALFSQLAPNFNPGDAYKKPELDHGENAHMSRKGWVIVLMHLMGADVIVAPSRAASAPAAPSGAWAGEVRRGAEATFFGLELKPVADGGVAMRMWMPALHAYAVPAGIAARSGDGFAQPESQIQFHLEKETLVGTFGEPPLPFSLRPASSPMPLQPVEAATATGPNPVWQYSTGAALWASPSVDHGVVYAGDAAGTLHAVRAADGSPVFRRALGTPLHGDPVAAGGAVFVLGDDGALYKLDAARGSTIWRRELGGGAVARSLPGPPSGAYDPRAPVFDFRSAAPVLLEGVVYVPTADGALHAIATGDGRTMWKQSIGGTLRSSAAAAGDRLIVGSWDGWVTCVSRADGRVLWRFDTGGPITNPPLVAGKLAIVGSRSADLFALDLGSGRVAWKRYHWMSWIESTPSLVDGVLYAGSSDGRVVRALEPATGRDLWSTDVGGWSWGTPLVFGDTVIAAQSAMIPYYIQLDASLVALDRKSGAIKWRRPANGPVSNGFVGYASSAARAGDLFVVGRSDGQLEAYEPTMRMPR